MARVREFDKDQVLDQAMLVFLEHGYEATSVRDLIKATNISSSSMYEVFGDKRGIFLQVLERYCAFEQARVVEMAAQAGSPREFIEMLFANVSGARGAQVSLALSTMVEFGTRDADVNARLIDHYFKIVEIISVMLAEAQANGVIATRLPAADLSHTILSTLYGILTVMSIKPESANHEAVKNTILTLIS